LLHGLDDAGDEHRLNGAEEGDAFYKEQGYKPKNAPLDTVDELLLIKGFTPEIVYGGPPKDPKGEPLRGIAHLLTTFGDGKVNVNTASREVLLTLTAGNGKMMDEWVVNDLLKYRLGDDGIPNTKDDGFASVQEAIGKSGMDPALAGKISVSDRQFVRVVSIGENRGVKNGVWAVFEVGERKSRRCTGAKSRRPRLSEEEVFELGVAGRAGVNQELSLWPPASRTKVLGAAAAACRMRPLWKGMTSSRRLWPNSLGRPGGAADLGGGIVGDGQHRSRGRFGYRRRAMSAAEANAPSHDERGGGALGGELDGDGAAQRIAVDDDRQLAAHGGGGVEGGAGVVVEAFFGGAAAAAAVAAVIPQQQIESALEEFGGDVRAGADVAGVAVAIDHRAARPVGGNPPAVSAVPSAAMNCTSWKRSWNWAGVAARSGEGW
jgi:hypothetical protein